MSLPVHRLTLSLLLIAAASSVAQVAGPVGTIVPRPPEPTAYGLELIRAEHWQPAGVDGKNQQVSANPGNQNFDRNSGEQSIADYRTLIEELEIEQGPYTGELAEALIGLAQNYQNRGDHQGAIDSFRRSIHLTRINQGPFTEEQIPLLDSLRESLLADTQMGELDQLQEYIYLVHRKALQPGDPRLERATQDYVEWQRSAYLQDLGDSGDRLLALHQLFDSALITLEQQSAPQSVRLPQLRGALQLAYLLDLHDTDRQPEFLIQMRQSNMEPALTAEESRLRRLQEKNYRDGLRAAKQLVEASEQDTPKTRAQALVAEGDWYQWQNKRVSARHSYMEAYTLLAESSEPERNKLFAAPVELPDDFIYLPDMQFDKREPRGRAKVRFTVSRNGRLRDLELLELSPQDRSAKIALRKMLRRLYFRPRLENGEAVETNGVEREYIFFDKP